MNRNLIGSLLFALIGATMLLPGLYLLFTKAASFLGSQAAPGVVVEIQHRHGVKSGSNEIAYPVVRFRAADGVEYTVEETRGYSGSQPFQEGDSVTVRYAPSNPRQAMIATFFEIWGPAVLLTLFGLAFLGAGLAAWSRFR